MERNDLFGTIILCSTFLIAVYIVNESARILGWGAV